MHVGFAASAALRAVLLAQAGADASDDVWGPAGFYRAFNGGQDMPPLPWQAQGPTALELPGFELKRFPSCYMTHRLVAGVLAIRARQTAHVGERVRIEIEVPRNGTSALKHPRPSTGLQGKFSGPYCAMAAWVDGGVGLAQFSNAAVLRSDLQARLADVQLRERDDASEKLESAPVNVEVQGEGWSDGIVVDWAPGSLADPMDREELFGKWRDCAAHGGVAGDVALLAALLEAPLNASAASLLAPLRRLLLGAIAAR